MNYNIDNIKMECKKRNYTFINLYKSENDGRIYIKYKCNIHNKELNTRYANFNSGCGCRYCAADKNAKKRNEKCKNEFKTKVYDLVQDEYTIIGEYTSANSKIKMKHNICNKEYDVTPSHFLGGSKCPFCAGKYKTTIEFKKQVYDLVQDEYTVISEYINSTTKLTIKHNACGHEYDVTPNKFSGGNRCPFCQLGSNNKSKLAHKIESFLCNNKIIYKKEYRFKDCKNKLPLPFDFAIFDKDKLYCIIEADGIQHFDDNTLFGNNSNTISNDNIKNNYCNKRNIKLIRIPYWDFNNVNNILLTELDSDLYNQSNGINLQYNKFDINTIIEIRKLYSLGQNSMSSICKLFNMNKYNISCILKYEIYSDVALEYKDKINYILNNVKSWKKNKIYCVDENIQNEINELYKTGEYTMRSLGRKYNIDHHLVSRIVKNK